MKIRNTNTFLQTLLMTACLWQVYIGEVSAMSSDDSQNRLQRWALVQRMLNEQEDSSHNTEHRVAIWRAERYIARYIAYLSNPRNTPLEVPDAHPDFTSDVSEATRILEYVQNGGHLPMR